LRVVDRFELEGIHGGLNVYVHKKTTELELLAKAQFLFSMFHHLENIHTKLFPCIAEVFAYYKYGQLCHCEEEFGNDKLCQVRWMVEEIRENSKKIWQLGKYLAIDEMMVSAKENGD
jgi:hypothetical protein